MKDQVFRSAPPSLLDKRISSLRLLNNSDMYLNVVQEGKIQGYFSPCSFLIASKFCALENQAFTTLQLLPIPP